MFRNDLIAALDVGTSKICCFIARVDPPNGEAARPRIIGTGHQVSQGLRNGVVVDMAAAERSILDAVHVAEKTADETISSVVVNLTGGRPRSQTVDVEVSIAGHEVGTADLRRVLDHSLAGTNGSERQLIHTIPVDFTIDGDHGIRDPRGMYGDRLGVQVHMITATSGAVRTLKTVIERCHLDIEGFVVSPYAAGLSSLVEDEIDLGATVIDMGAGATGITVFYDGQAIYADSVPAGGAHVTNDVARGLSTPLAHAERLKTLYGNASAGATGGDEHDLIDVPQVGEDSHEAPSHISRSILNGIIQPRLEEIFELVRARLAASGIDRLAGRRVVLTGGASQLQGVRELAALVLDKQVRLGRPLRLRGLADAMAGPAFATCAGLIAFAVHQPTALPVPAPAARGDRGGFSGRLGQWLREYF